MRLVDAVAAPLFGQGGAAGVVAVFEGMPRFVGAACAQVDAEHRLDIEYKNAEQAAIQGRDLEVAVYGQVG